MWPELKDRLMADIATIRVGDVADFTNFMGAVIDEKSWRKLDGAIAEARASNTETVLTDGAPDMSEGYFVPPTLVETTDLSSRGMNEEFFGPIVTAFVYEDNAFDEIIGRIDAGSAYGLTGAIFARESGAITRALDGLRYAAGNVYVNDKSTGAVVGQQPFGGARASGTNDKAGSMWNLARWVSPRTIKEAYTPPTDYRYPSMR
jgi:1-pyrroline-5-carboxylate dehydrogenase